MAECICTSKQHGHGDHCGRTAVAQKKFCIDCQERMNAECNVREEPQLTPKTHIQRNEKQARLR
jgi:hypothetical protein